MLRQQEIKLDIDIDSKHTVDELIQQRCSAEPIIPELVEEQQIRVPEAYNRFRNLDAKEKFREKIIKRLYKRFKKEYGANKAHELIEEFQKLAQDIDKNGAIIFGNMIDTAHFQELINMYTEKLSTDGSKSWIHSYINFGNHPDFLNSDKFSNALFHPLLISLISYSAGGPIRIVDARGKDAEPLAVQAQDNMLHIDNTPFRKEYKVILTWERGKPSGPKGQNFVFIPGTHKGVRNCKVSEKGEAWSTEDGSIFTSEEAVQTIFDMQEKILPGQSPAVVEASHPTMPLTTIFEAGALVHHRYRTKEKNVPRSCVIVAFHRAQDNSGQFLSSEHLDKVAKKGSLPHLLMGKHSDNTEKQFIDSVLSNATIIADKMEELKLTTDNTTKVVPFSTRVLDEEELKVWKKTVTLAPTVEAIKSDRAYFHLGDTLAHELLTEMMMYDKHGPLDLILYGDGHEEIRKWARNRIREMPVARLENRLRKFAEWDLMTTPKEHDLLTLEQLKEIAENLVHFIDQLPDETKENATLDKQEKISQRDAYRSIRQLIDDLGEAIVRCTSRQTFLSTSLFLFWACDELSCLLAGRDEKPNEDLLKINVTLLSHYMTTYILVEKQIEMEKQLRDAVVIFYEEKESTVTALPTPQRESQMDIFSPLPNSETSDDDTLTELQTSLLGGFVGFRKDDLTYLANRDRNQSSSIVVSFREEQGRTMHAAFYDHYVIRKITNHDTVIAIAPAIGEEYIKEKVQKFEDYTLNNTSHTLALNGKTKKVIPSIHDSDSHEGLLFIPGQRKFPKPGEHYEERKAYEYKLIQNALLRGQPILAICGGSWKLWDALGGETAAVEGHVSPSMPTIFEDGSVGNNPQVHAIKIMDNTILKGCMSVKTGVQLKETPTVNSVHWAAPVANEHIVQMVQISAVSTEKETNPQTQPEDNIVPPTLNTIEAFENRYGAPFLGIQWHPEAYFKKQYNDSFERSEYERQLNIIKYMAKCGDAFQTKQKMLEEFKKTVSPSEQCIKLGIFSRRNNPLPAHSVDKTLQRSLQK